MPTNLADTIASLMDLQEKVHYNVKQPSKSRRIVNAVRDDIISVLKNFWPALLHVILAAEQQAKEAYMNERSSLESSGHSLENMTTPFHPTTTLINLSMEKTKGIAPCDSRVATSRSSRNERNERHVHAVGHEGQDVHARDRPGNAGLRGQGRGGGNACWLCGKAGQVYSKCFAYPGEEPGKAVCHVCSGRHTSRCALEAKLVNDARRPNSNAGRGRRP